MSVTVANIYRGPLSGITVDDAGGSAPADLGAIGANNAEITFEGQPYELGDGQSVELYGVGKVVIEIAETDNANVELVDRTALQKLILTALDGTTYTIDNIFLSVSTKRGFGADPHILTISGTKKAVDEDDFVVIA